MVLFLSQNPAKPENVKRPLVGTRSYRTFQAWLKALGSPDHVLLNASDRLGKVTWRDYRSRPVMEALSRCTHFIALGAYASGLLELLEVKHFQLPHPSGLNRKLNNSEELEQQLRLCRIYIDGSDTLPPHS
jgi:hypothetical protein